VNLYPSYLFNPSWVPNQRNPVLSWIMENIELCDNPFSIEILLNSNSYACEYRERGRIKRLRSRKNNENNVSEILSVNR
jgi:hypothetical protein